MDFFGDDADIKRIDSDNDDIIDERTETEEENSHKNIGEFDQYLRKENIPHDTEGHCVEQREQNRHKLAYLR